MRPAPAFLLISRTRQTSNMKLSGRAKKRLAAAAAIVVLVFILASPTYYSGKPGIDFNASSDYYNIYYGNGTAGLAESWLEFHSPLDLYAYYYCGKKPGLRVGVFVIGTVGEGINAQTNGAGNSSGGDDAGCFGFTSPIPARGELDPYGPGWRVCYGLRLVESASCAYG